MIFVLGATGQLGMPLVSRLSKAGVPFRALAHSEASTARLDLPGAEVVVGDLTRPETLAEHMKGVSKLFLLTPALPGQVEMQNALVDVARDAGVGSIVKLSVYTAGEHTPCEMCRWHWQNDEYIKASGVDWTILYPHTYMQTIALQFAAGVRANDSMRAAVRVDRRIEMVDVHDVADVAAAVLTSDGHEGQEYTILGPEALSYADCAFKLSGFLGRIISYTQITPEEVAADFTAAGFPQWLVELLVDLQKMYDSGEWRPVSDVTQRLAGHSGRTFDEFLRAQPEVFA